MNDQPDTTDRYTEAEVAAIRKKRTEAHAAPKAVMRRAGISRDPRLYVSKNVFDGTRPLDEPDRLRLLPTIARCMKCGREFATMPFDRIDHYAPPGSVRETRLSYRAASSGDPEPCGGMVMEVERAGQ